MPRRPVLIAAAALAVGGVLVVLTTIDGSKGADRPSTDERGARARDLSERLEEVAGGDGEVPVALPWVPVDSDTVLVYAGTGSPVGDFTRTITRAGSSKVIEAASTDTFVSGAPPATLGLNFGLEDDGSLRLPLEAFFIGAERPTIVDGAAVRLDPADPLSDGPIERHVEIELGPPNLRQRAAALLHVRRAEAAPVEVPAGSFAAVRVDLTLDIALPSGPLVLHSTIWVDPMMGVVRQTIGQAPQQIDIVLERADTRRAADREP